MLQAYGFVIMTCSVHEVAVIQRRLTAAICHSSLHGQGIKTGNLSHDTQQQNELLTRTNRGTPAGELLRRYWQPVALSEELPQGAAPVSVKILGEELVLSRDDDGPSWAPGYRFE